MSPGNLLLCAFWLSAVAPSADPEFNRITSLAAEDNRDEVCTQMQAWVDSHPRHPDSARGLVWIAKLRRADGRDDLARTAFERVLKEAPDSLWALDAIDGTAALDRKAHRYDRAIEGYSRLARSSNPMWRYLGEYSALYTRGEQTRFRVLIALALVLGVLVLSRLWRTGVRGLWPPPLELVYPFPVLLLVLCGASALEVPEGHTVFTVGLGSVVLLWLGGAYLRSQPPVGARRLVEVAIAIFQASTLLYGAVVMNGLWEKLVDTVSMGAE